jgi:uncharacterized membrane protein (UPF0182 family)
VLFTVFTSFMTDLLWFRSIEYSHVFTTKLVTRGTLFGIFGLLMAGVVCANIIIAYRLRPSFRGMSAEQQNLDRYRLGLEAYRKMIVALTGVVLGVMAGASAAGEWRTWLQWRNSTSFGKTDPQFGKDISFYMFSYPWWRFLLGFAFAVVLVSLLASLVTHYLYGGLRLQTPGEKATPAAQAHLSVLLGIFVLLKAVAYWLDRYGLAVHGGGFDQVEGWSGLRYRDVNAVLPAKTILAAIALICALLFFANVVQRTWMLPGIGFGLLVLSAILIGGVYPAAVQQFKVRPSEATSEAPYIQRNIDATREAYGLSDVKISPYDAKTVVEPGQLREDAATTTSIRLLDPNIVSPTFQQDQQLLRFYSFPDTLRVDRYTIDGKKEDVVVAVRELDLDNVPPEQRNWINDHLLYTHGYGFVAARGNTVNSEGAPEYVAKNIPPEGELKVDQPRIYFGEESPEYSIVGSSTGNKREFDYPIDNSKQENNTYDGKGGVSIGSFWRQLLYAVKFKEEKILLSQDVNPASKVLYIRDPRERIGRVAPWLTLDRDPYPAVVNGRIQWIVDGYTTSANYPYASRTTLGRATETTLTANDGQRIIAPRDEVNYIRNSVKATVDAYDGTVALYEWNQKADPDPVLATWKKAFPDTVLAESEIPPALLTHLRYPEDYFKVQRQLLARYHVTNPGDFYSKADFWQVPDDPTAGDVTGLAPGAVEKQPPYYLTLKMPKQETPAFSLTTTFEPLGRPQLAAFMAVNAEPGPDYGTIRVLQVRGSSVAGPTQAQNFIVGHPNVTETLSPLRITNRVRFGNLLTLPVGGGLLYVEPVYVQQANQKAFPLLRQIIVAFGNNVAMAGTLQEALDQVFQGESGVTTTAPAGSPEDDNGAPPGTGAPTGAPKSANAELLDALSAIDKAHADQEAALKAGDFTAFGEAYKKMTAAIDRADAARARLNGGSSAPTPAPANTPSTTPSARASPATRLS